MAYIGLHVEQVLAAASAPEEAHELHGSLDGQLLVHVVQLIPNLKCSRVNAERTVVTLDATSNNFTHTRYRMGLGASYSERETKRLRYASKLLGTTCRFLGVGLLFMQVPTT